MWLFKITKSQGLKENAQGVTLTHYINDLLLNFDGLIPLALVKYPMGDIEKTHRNSSSCSFFENLEAKTTMSRPKFTNPFSYVQST